MKKLLILILICSCSSVKEIPKSQKMGYESIGTIKENISFIIEYQKKMGYYMPNIINPPVTDNQIQDAEKELGMKMNGELKELFKTINGVKLDGKTVSGLTGIIPIHDLSDLKSSIQGAKYMDWDEHVGMYEIKSKLGHKLFPFINDGSGNCYWVDLNEGTKNYGRLYWTNSFGDEPGYLFNSLTDFFEAIKRGYEQGIFTLDENGNLDCDYKKWGEICHNLDKSIRYWKEYVN